MPFCSSCFFLFISFFFLFFEKKEEGSGARRRRSKMHSGLFPRRAEASNGLVVSRYRARGNGPSASSNLAFFECLVIFLSQYKCFFFSFVSLFSFLFLFNKCLYIIYIHIIYIYVALFFRRIALLINS